MLPADTIAAIATPLGEAGLAVVRISGPEALAVADRCFVPASHRYSKPSEAASHTLHYGHIYRKGQVVDEVIVAVMRSPRTFTREDVVEISCHGGILTTKLVLDTVLECGARMAHPGEFTRRAFLNGRLDLAQAEAVADLIHSRTELAVRAANEQLAGKLSERIKKVRDSLMRVLANVEAHIDFPEEDITPDSRQEMLAKLRDAHEKIEQLLATANEGRLLRSGIRAAIVGRPNVGKSSLLNLLLGHDRAIVSPIPGTTRDTIEETANIRGIPVVFVDTAGLRESEDAIEAEGVRRSHAAIEQAELILHVLDNSQPWSDVDARHWDLFSSRKQLLVINKTDLPSRLSLPDNLGGRVARVCCLTGAGLESLKDSIKELVWSGEINAEALQIMINSRHQEALNRCLAAVARTIEALDKGFTLELAAMDLRIAVQAVGEITGQTATEDLLDTIFSHFCIGK